MVRIVALIAVLAGWIAWAGPAPAATLADIKARGSIYCGVATSTPGFATRSDTGAWAGLDVDYCRALAAAIFNDVSRVTFEPLGEPDAALALTQGKVDLLSGALTWTMARDTSMGMKFAGTMFYDGLGFMVRKASGAESVRDLGHAHICIPDTGIIPENIDDYLTANNIDYVPVSLPDAGAALAAYRDGRCDVLTAQVSSLAAERSAFEDRDSHVILPEIAAKEPLGLAVRIGDDGWLNLVRWTYFALVDAEELGVTSANIDQMLGSDNPEIKRLIGVEGDFGTPLGVSKDWAYQIIKLVGNYGEIFERNVGPKTTLGLTRGLNALWKDGGLQYAPAIR